MMIRGSEVLRKKAVKIRNQMLGWIAFTSAAFVGLFLLIMIEFFESFGPEAWCIPAAAFITIGVFYFLFKIFIDDKPRQKMRTK